MTQQNSHRTRSLIALLILFGCATENSENWAITNPVADQLFTMTNAEATINQKMTTVSGTCGQPNIGNMMAVGDNNNSMVSGPYAITSGNDATNSWSKAQVVLAKPMGTPYGVEFPLKIATGRPIL